MNKILEIISGSHLYGTNTETSDRDYVGIFVPEIEYILGFKKVEEVDMSIKNKLENGKNSNNAIDRKFYEFRKFISLALDNNPNIVEMLFVNKQNIVEINNLGEELLKRKSLFIHKGLKQKFLGYAFSQKHKMIIKKDNYFDLINALDYLRNVPDKRTMLEVSLEKHCPHFIKTVNHSSTGNKHIAIGDVMYTPARQVSDVRKSIADRVDRAGNREELLLKYGFDTKFASHLVRLMLEGVELLKTQKLEFPLKNSQLLLDIKNGKWSISDILKYSTELENEIESLEKTSSVPKKPDRENIETFTILTLKEIVNADVRYE